MRWFARLALLPGGLARDVLFDEHDGRFTAISADAAARAAGATALPGVVLPGLANCHSHAFHRALRGRTHGNGGTFWTWRDLMYRLAATLDPDSYFALARAVYAEMALAGITSVGEFHYVHHRTDGRPYADPNAMGRALVAAAGEAGIRITLLDACYLSSGVAGEPLGPQQVRFGDGDVGSWAGRVALLADAPGARIGVAVHSVRAVPRAALSRIAEVGGGRPMHVHLSEQPAENADCLAVHGLTPTGLLSREGVLGPATTAVHATHLSVDDIALLATSGTSACFCPSTERDLADGIGPGVELHAAGVPLTLGSDQHATIDLLAEAQSLEGDQRMMSLQRGRFAQAELLSALTAHGSLGWPDAGHLEVGARADLVAVRTDTVRTAGSDPAQILMTAAAADVDTVLVDGVRVVQGGRHRIGDVGALLAATIRSLTDQS